MTTKLMSPKEYRIARKQQIVARFKELYPNGCFIISKQFYTNESRRCPIWDHKDHTGETNRIRRGVPLEIVHEYTLCLDFNTGAIGYEKGIEYIRNKSFTVFENGEIQNNASFNRLHGIIRRYSSLEKFLAATKTYAVPQIMIDTFMGKYNEENKQ